MSGDSKTGLIVSTTIASLFCVLCVSVSFYVMYRLLKFKDDDLIQYFTHCIQFTLICGTLTSIASLGFCISHHVDPYNYNIHGEKWWLHHSFIFRAVSTCLWYLQKIGLFFIFNGRLYYGFIKSNYAISRFVFLSLNTLTAIIAISTLSFSYCALLLSLPQDITTFGFQSFRIWWTFASVIFIILFNVRLLSVSIYIAMNFYLITNICLSMNLYLITNS